MSSGSGVKTYTDKARQWWENGFEGEVIPYEPGSNRPKAVKGWNTQQWGWDQLKFDLDHGYNFGLRTEKYPALDIEASPHTPKILDAVYGWLQARGHKDVSVRFRRGSSSHVVLTRLDDPWGHTRVKPMAIITKDGTRLFEIKFGPSSPIHLVGWREDYKAEVNWTKVPVASELPPVEVADLVDLVSHIRKVLEDNGVELSPASGTAVPGTTGQKPEQGTPEEVKSLLDLIPNDHHFQDRDEWIKVGHAIRGASNGEQWGEDLWNEWCDQQPQRPGEVERVWKSFVNPAVGINALRDYAKKRNPQKYALALFDDEIFDTSKDKDPVNPGTGKPRWLAREVMRRALQEDTSNASGADPVTTLGDIEDLALTLKQDPPILKGWIHADVAHGLIAQPGLGKSLLMLHLAYCGAAGVDPRDPKKRIEQISAITLFGEDALTVVVSRLLAIKKNYPHLQAGEVLPRDSVFTTHTLKSLRLVQIDEKTKRIVPEITPGLRQLCDNIEGAMLRHPSRGIGLFLDMMRNTYQGDDNVRWNIDALFTVYKAIMSAVRDAGGPPIGILFSHHTSKHASRTNSTDFASAGSIGIEGNARKITTLTKTSANTFDAIATKDNYGITGRTEAWEKVEDVSPLGGVGVWLRPQTLAGTQLAFRMDELVEEVWNWMEFNPAVVVNHGRRDAAGTRHVRELSGLAMEDEVAQLVARGEALGAWKTAQRVRQGGMDIKTALVRAETWRPSRDNL
jgi:AAA domain/Primase C terminal 2 (PriCT-2)